MTTVNIHTAGWTAAPTQAIIGPDGNLWAVNNGANVYKFNTTTFATTTYAVSGATALIGIVTDGTYLYASDYAANATPFTVVYKITTSGSSSAFYHASAAAFDAGAMYFDGSDLWVASSLYLTQLNLSGGVVSQYTGAHALALDHLLNDGTYWFVGGNSGSMYRTPVSSPGTWTAITFGGGFTYPGVSQGGYIWAGGANGSIYAITPSSGAVTTFTPSGLSSPSSDQIAFDGTSLWVCFRVGGLWQTTPGAPTVGVNYSLGVDAATVLYNAATQTIWATGFIPSQGYAYSVSLATMKIVGII